MNSKDLLFSIITPCFNSEKTIERTILSVLNQTYTNFEYIIIDGGSTDSTLEIIEKYKDKFGDKLKVISEKDNGIYDAMNKGIRLSTGDLVGIINSDDYYEYNCLELVMHNYSGKKYEIIYGITRHLDEKGFETSLHRKNHNHIQNEIMCHQSCFLTNRIYKELYLYNLEYKYVSDYDLIVRCYNNKEVYFSNIDSVIVNFSAGGASSSIDCMRENLMLRKKYKFISKSFYVQRIIVYYIKKYIFRKK